jgi:hypothetical protein
MRPGARGPAEVGDAVQRNCQRVSGDIDHLRLKAGLNAEAIYLIAIAGGCLRGSSDFRLASRFKRWQRLRRRFSNSYFSRVARHPRMPFARVPGAT